MTDVRLLTDTTWMIMESSKENQKMKYENQKEPEKQQPENFKWNPKLLLILNQVPQLFGLNNLQHHCFKGQIPIPFFKCQLPMLMVHSRTSVIFTPNNSTIFTSAPQMLIGACTPPCFLNTLIFVSLVKLDTCHSTPCYVININSR